MKQNKHNRKDDLSSVDSTKRIYKMYKRKKNWVIAPVIFGLLAPTLIAGPVTVLAEDVVAPVAEATTRDSLDDARTKGQTRVQQIEEIKQGRKEFFIKEIGKAISGAEIHDIVVDAYKEQFQGMADDFTLENETVIKALSGLSVDEKAVAVAELPKITVKPVDNDLDNHDGDYILYLSEIDLQQEVADKVIAKYTKISEENNLVNQGFDVYKDAKILEIENMNHLKKNEKKAFQLEVTNSTSTSKAVIQAIVDRAALKNQYNLDTKIYIKKQELNDRNRDELWEATGGNSETFRNIQTKISNASTLEDLAFIEKEIDAIIAGEAAGEAAKKLVTHKTEAISKINGDAYANGLTTADTQPYINKVNAATTMDAVDLVVADWQADLNVRILDKTTSILTVRTKAEAMVRALLYLSEPEKTVYIDSIRDKNVKADIITVLKEAQAADRLAKMSISEKLVAAKEAAKKVVNGLEYLTADDKKKACKDIDEAIDLDDVASKLKDAEWINTNLKYRKLKAEAKATIENLGFLQVNPTAGDRGVDYYLDAIDAIFVTTADFEGELEKIVIKAQDANTVVGLLATNDLTEVVKIANAHIDEMLYLSETEKADAKKEIKAADRKSFVEDAITSAEKLNLANKEKAVKAKELVAAKAKALKDLDNLTYLSERVRNAYKGQVNNAKSVSAIVDDIMTKADAENARIKAELAGLEVAQSTAILVLKDLDQLTTTERASYKTLILAATSKEAVENVVQKAIDVNNNRNFAVEDDLTQLSSDITTAITNLDKLGYGQKTLLGYELAAALTRNDRIGMMDVYKKAVAMNTKEHDDALLVTIKNNIRNGSFVSAQKDINNLRDDVIRAKYQNELDTMITLAQTKADAYKVIDTLVGMSETEKIAAKDKIAKMETKKEVDEYLKELIAEDNQQNDGELIKLAESQIKEGKFDEAAKTIAKVKDKDERARLTALLNDAKSVPEVTAQAHVSNIGWMPGVTSGNTSGTTGQSKQMEAIKLSLGDSKVSGGIEYSAHVSNIGWMKPVADGAMAGTTGQSRRMEAVRIKLTGDMAKKYDVYYRGHVSNIGWQAWSSNGQTAGTTGQSRRMEAIQIKLVLKGEPAPR